MPVWTLKPQLSFCIKRFELHSIHTFACAMTASHTTNIVLGPPLTTEKPTYRIRNRKRMSGDFRDQDDLHMAEYYYENGLRKVRPYYFVYKAFAKGRWLGRPLLEVLTKEFQDRNESYYQYAIETALITLNAEKVDKDTIVRNGDVLGHVIHRHEPPVTDQPIEIIHKGDDLFVINKPAGIPVHPAGRFRHNTVTHILRKTHGLPPLYPANRLDRPTSGLLLIARTPARARMLEREMTQGMIQKTYLCRVDGEFPEGEIVCEQPIKTLSHKLSLNYVHENGKLCKTSFQRLSYNGKSSVVQCQPHTGRTHQIRVHLRYLGHPICNDITYGSRTEWAHLMGKGQVMNDADGQRVVDTVLQTVAYPTGLWESERTEVEADRCPDCGIAMPPEPKLDQLSIWLHAWKYATKEWTFETEMPSWAKQDFVH